MFFAFTLLLVLRGAFYSIVFIGIATWQSSFLSYTLLFIPISFSAFGEIATLRNTRKDGTGGLLTKGSSLLFLYSPILYPNAQFIILNLF